uniref:4HBT domain-containing protein n=1 Tax=Panagrellus redivivus TaxID=6233 RepID=A0A7E4VVA6_PANRE
MTSKPALEFLKDFKSYWAEIPQPGIYYTLYFTKVISAAPGNVIFEFKVPMDATDESGEFLSTGNLICVVDLCCITNCDSLKLDWVLKNLQQVGVTVSLNLSFTGRQARIGDTLVIHTKLLDVADRVIVSRFIVYDRVTGDLHAHGTQTAALLAPKL